MMDKLLPCPFCGGEAKITDGGFSGEQFLVRCRELLCPAASGTVRKTQKQAISTWNRRAQPDNARPPCYLPEKDNPYPLCIGRGMTACAHCCLWADYEPEQDESRVNNPLTPADRIRSMSDKELAEYIFDLGNGSEYCYGHCAYQDDCATKGLDHDTCIKGVIDWLKQPAKEVHK